VAARPTRFVIIGNGHLRPTLEARARELGVQNDVLFTGLRSDPEFFYPALDVVALTSLNEGTPLTLIEALANGRPAISTAVGGVVDVLGPAEGPEPAPGVERRHRGLTVASGDVEAFCRGLTRLLDDAPLRQSLGAAGPAYVRQAYSKERLIDDTAALYDSLLYD
jgi:glycosyltransferase involved in cell wall biosynthesis